MSTAPDGELPVIDEDGRPLGVLTRTALAERLSGEDGGPASTAGQLVELRPTVSADATVADALELLDRHEARGLVVSDGTGVIGWFSARAVLDRLRHAEGAPAG
jgi:CBS domain-containing protein